MHPGIAFMILIGFAGVCITACIIVDSVLIEKRKRLEVELEILKLDNGRYNK